MWHRGKGESAARAATRACGPAREWGQKAQAKAHSEHSAHVCGAGGVKAQRLVESTRILPSPKGGIRQRDDACTVAHGDVAQREGRISMPAHAACVRGPAREWGQKAQRTKNIAHMDVTLEVSKLSGWLKASAPCRVQKLGGIRQKDDACGTEMCGTGERANQQRTRRACVAQLGSAGRRRRGKRT
jgi:hypothetical protein